MKLGLPLFLKLSARTFLQSRGTPARLTPKRAAVMALFIPSFAAVQIVHWLAFKLDDILFPGYRTTLIRKPLFIVGIPRSGTTHLHQVLAADTERFTTTSLWELIFAPAIVERKLLLGAVKLDRRLGRPLGKLFDWANHKAFGGMQDIHPIDLTAPEEDYFLLLPEMACFLLIHPFPFAEMWRVASFDKSIPPPERERVMAAYKARLQRHVYFHGPDKIVLSKNPAFSGFVRSLQKTFPDCRIVCNVRPPASSVPSLVSSMQEGVDLFDNDPRGTEYRDKLMAMLRFFYKHLGRHVLTMPRDRHRVVPMKELKSDLPGVVEDIYERFGYEITARYREALDVEWEKARAYKSRHKHSLEQFGLTEEQVEEYFAEAAKAFDFERGA